MLKQRKKGKKTNKQTATKNTHTHTQKKRKKGKRKDRNKRRKDGTIKQDSIKTYEWEGMKERRKKRK